MKRRWLNLYLVGLLVLLGGLWPPRTVAAAVPPRAVAATAQGPRVPDWLAGLLAALDGRSATSSGALAPDAPSDPGLVAWGSYCNVNTTGEPPYDADTGANPDNVGRAHTWTIAALNGGQVQDPGNGQWVAATSGGATGSHGVSAYTHGCGSTSTPCSYRVTVSNAGYACGDICLYANGLNCSFARWQGSGGSCYLDVSATQNPLNGLWGFGGALFHVNPCGGATDTPTATPTATATSGAPPTATVTSTSTATRTPTATSTTTSTPSATATAAPTATASPTGTRTLTPTPTAPPTATSTATRTNTPTNTTVPPSATPTNTSVPFSATPTQTPTATRTNTPTATPTSTTVPPTAPPTSTPLPPTAPPTVVPPTQTPTATPIPVTLSLQATYRYLLWYGPVTQVLTGQRNGPAPLGWRQIQITMQDPTGIVTTYLVRTRVGGGFTLDALVAGEPDFGVTALGTWRAQAQDVATGAVSNQVIWDVKWFRIHLRQ